ncbi:MAG: FAD-binding protein [Acidimicrobiia bacterium]
MDCVLIPSHALTAPSVAAAVSHAPHSVWAIMSAAEARPNSLGRSCTFVTADTEHPFLLATTLSAHLGSTDDIYIPMCAAGRELGAALSIVMQRPLIGPVLHREHDTVTVVLGDRCVTVTASEPSIYLVAAQPAAPPLPPIESHANLDLSSAVPGTADTLRTTALHDPDPASIDLEEASRIVAAGIGCKESSVVTQLGEVGAAIGASLGATRVITDAGWLPFERQIGTTGAIVSPDLYLAFGVSGAVQHLSGIGRPDHVIAVNTDAGAPMMKFADLAICADAPETIAALARRLATAEGAAPRHEDGDPT